MTAYQLTPHETVTVTRRDDALVVEVEYLPGGSPPPAHLHPSQVERFEILEGSLRVVIDGQERPLKRGESVDIPAGTAHRMWNAGDSPARALWTTSPPGRTEQWFATVERLGQGRSRIDILGFAVALGQYGDTFVLVGPLRIILAALARVARLTRLRRTA
jgi:mannose-6-phosphate isomerase-like protein (cupin superfamily)